RVPGGRWVNYTRPVEGAAAGVVAAVRPGVTVARFVLDGAGLPGVEETLPVAGQVRRRLMGGYRGGAVGGLGLADLAGGGGGERVASEVFAGKDAAGRPLEGHGHAFFLPSDDDGDGRLDHVTLYAARGFDPSEQAALARLRELSWGPRPLRL